jgi:putative ABC transport system ATP-binding protein
MNDQGIVHVQGLTKQYRQGDETITALRGIDLDIRRGERVAIMGPSGCGKSTLLSLIGGLDRPTSGTIRVAGNDIASAGTHEMAMIRRKSLGFILQTPSLLPMLTARENIELPMSLNGVGADRRRERALELLALTELSDKAESLPEELSGGQQQRVSVMRALATRPQLILADEPAGSLDSITGDQVLALIAEAAKQDSITVLMVTHDQDDTRYADRTIRLKDGQVVAEGVLR